MVQSLVLNYPVLLSLCVMPLFYWYLDGTLLKVSLCWRESPKPWVWHFPLLFQFAQKSLKTPELRRCHFVHECLVFACPLVVLHVKPFFFNVPSCLCGLCYSILSEGELKHFPIIPNAICVLLFGSCFGVPVKCCHVLMFLL